MVLNTRAIVGPEGSQGTSSSESPASTSTAGRSLGAGAISARSEASRSIPTPVIAEPHTTGNTTPSTTPDASVASSSSVLGVSPSR